MTNLHKVIPEKKATHQMTGFFSEISYVLFYFLSQIRCLWVEVP